MLFRSNNELEIFRNEVIEEVAAHLEKEFQIPFAQDTLDSFVIYIREMKRPLPNGS